jgi:hypothetical protein
MAELTTAAIFSMCNLTSGHCGAQHNNSYSAASKILLVLNVFVSGKENIEPGSLRFG